MCADVPHCVLRSQGSRAGQGLREHIPSGAAGGPAVRAAQRRVVPLTPRWRPLQTRRVSPGYTRLTCRGLALLVQVCSLVGAGLDEGVQPRPLSIVATDDHCA